MKIIKFINYKQLLKDIADGEGCGYAIDKELARHNIKTQYRQMCKLEVCQLCPIYLYGQVDGRDFSCLHSAELLSGYKFETSTKLEVYQGAAKSLLFDIEAEEILLGEKEENGTID